MTPPRSKNFKKILVTGVGTHLAHTGLKSKSTYNFLKGVKLMSESKSKQEVYQAELEKLNGLFEGIDENKKQLAGGLIQDAAFLTAENYMLREILSKTGAVKVHPDYPEIQRPVEAARQYRQNVNAYAVLIKALDRILSSNSIEEEDDELASYE